MLYSAVPDSLDGWIPVAGFGGDLRLYHYEQSAWHSPDEEHLTMRFLTLTPMAILTAALVTGCVAESTPTSESRPGLTANIIDHNTADHFTAVDPVSFEVENPCNGESIIFTGTAESQITLVDTREHLDAGFSVHTEFQQHTTATGTGSESGATYTINDIFHEGFESPNPPAPHATISAHGTTRVSSNIDGLSFLGHFVFQAVIPSGQEFKVTVSLDRLTCS